MIEGTIAIRYARALMSLAQDGGHIDEFGVQLKNFLNYCQENKYLLSVLSNKGFDLNSRIEIINQIADKSGFHVLVKNFFKLLINKGRVELIDQIYNEYQKMADQALNRCPMTVISSDELPEEQYNQLIDYFGKKTQQKMILQKEFDPNVLGGARVKIGDQIYDYTLRRHLSDLKQKMLA